MSHDSPSETVDRRRFLTVLGATGAGTVALSGCSTSKVEKLIPYLVQAEDQVPGVPTYYASTCTECSAGCGLHVKTREGRAIKLEGNPDHPINQGALCARGQAGLQGLYNPGRLTSPMAKGAGGRLAEITWDDALARFAEQLKGAGSKVAVISGAGQGTFADLLSEWTTALGGQLVRYEPFSYEPIREANRTVFGRDELPVYDVAKAKYIISFGADFLDTWLAPVEMQRGFAEARRTEGGEMAKFVSFAPRMNLTGMNADQWHPIAPGSEAALALAMANVLVSERASGLGSRYAAALAPFTPEKAAQETGLTPDLIRRIAREFASAKPSLALAGGVASQHRQATEVCVAVNLLNLVAGNLGETVRLGAAPQGGDGFAALQRLAAKMQGGEVSLLLVHEANPLYATPASAKLGDAFAKVPFKVSTSLFLDETAAACDLLLPGLHALERWDDLHPRAGVASLMQPVMQPVRPGMHTGDVLLKVSQTVGGALAKFGATSFEAHLKAKWQPVAAREGKGDAEAGWRSSVARGGVFSPAATVAPAADAGLSAIKYTAPAFDGDGEFTLMAFPHPLLFDGRGTNKPWLLENADPVSKLTWDSWIELHPETAARLDVRDGEILQLTSPHGSVEAPAFVFPGIHPDVLAVPLGFGHSEYGDFAKGRGINPLDLIGVAPTDGFVAYQSARVSVTKANRYKQLPTIAGVSRQLGRGIAEAMPLADIRRGLTLEASLRQEHGAHEVNPERELEALHGWREAQQEATKLGAYAGAHERWAMVIDLNSCTGCQACVTACYAENNIPVVGEDDILRGREMTWMRIERYYEGGEAPGEPLSVRFIPMLCQQCGNAPCEPVCPVYAAYHTPDGLNGQVYNRCVGTRYCANNCPYKVRYFNWYKYNERAFPEPLNWQLNPDVTVRARGVMEKCTFCIQRIRHAQNEAKLEDRAVADGEVVTACAQACPSQAIVFGNANDPASRVSRAQQITRGYHVLEDVNTRPAVTYLAKVLHETEA